MPMLTNFIQIDEQLDKTNEDLEAAAVPMPAFGNIQIALAKEMDEEPTEQESKIYLTALESAAF